jgi:hypothetical protein
MGEFIGKGDQLGDTLAKPLGKNKFQELRGKNGIIVISKQHG